MPTDIACSDRAAGDGPGACPFMFPRAMVGRAAVYCRLPGGRARVPQPDERRRYCGGGWGHCPSYLGAFRGARARFGLP